MYLNCQEYFFLYFYTRNNQSASLSVFAFLYCKSEVFKSNQTQVDWKFINIGLLKSFVDKQANHSFDSKISIFFAQTHIITHFTYMYTCIDIKVIWIEQ